MTPTESSVAAEIAAMEALTRLLVGIAWNSAHAAPAGVSFPQMRLLLTLASLGPTPSTRLARALGADPSSVTRLGDRLESQGYLARERDSSHRSRVYLTVTPAGEAVVARVLTERAQAFTTLLDRLPAERRQLMITAAQDLVGASTHSPQDSANSPAPAR
ncbi:MarR family winged helix-turn-helix transcriptional regulator [Nocardia jejuensis]|uniref:MarR family winged helix-turn-helix transcriptional regulator n=1 Tax=Nocardia jejuensis TaxID=328049 RepID=UPI000832A1AC|nr:MarR family transcriptional regulator [Nocardia jejuensis]